MTTKFKALYLWFLIFGGRRNNKNNSIRNEDMKWDFIKNFQIIKSEMEKYVVQENNE
jgi:hypothetical protein